MRQDRFDKMRVVVDAKLVGDGQQQRIGGGDRLILSELFDEYLGLGGIGTAEDGLLASRLRAAGSTSLPDAC